MIKTNIRTILHYDLKYKGFCAQINIDRSSLAWGYILIDPDGKTAAVERKRLFMSEKEIEDRMKIMIKDCIQSPEDYY